MIEKYSSKRISMEEALSHRVFSSSPSTAIYNLSTDSMTTLCNRLDLSYSLNKRNFKFQRSCQTLRFHKCKLLKVSWITDRLKPLSKHRFYINWRAHSRPGTSNSLMVKSWAVRKYSSRWTISRPFALDKRLWIR